MMATKSIERSETAQAVLAIVAMQLDKQEQKGLETYGHSLDGVVHDPEGDVYDWTSEALAECIDGMQYLVKRVQELEAQERPMRRKAMNQIRSDFAHAEADMHSKGDVFTRFEMGQAVGFQQGVAATLRSLHMYIDGINR